LHNNYTHHQVSLCVSCNTTLVPTAEHLLHQLINCNFAVSKKYECLFFLTTTNEMTNCNTDCAIYNRAIITASLNVNLDSVNGDLQFLWE